MKKYSLIFLAFLFVACSDFLEEDPRGKLSPDNFFQSKNDLDMAITAMYYYSIQFNQQPGRMIYTYCADDVTTQNAGNKTRWAEFDMFNFNSGNSEMGNWYAYLWRTVKAANFVINNAERTPASEEYVNERLGQAYLMRAYCYFHLVRIWGKTPIITTLEPDYDAPREDVTKVYELIESDCKQAEKMLPINFDSEPYSRNGINVAGAKGAAKALLASVYMTEAGWPLKKGTEYYEKAASKFKEIIDNESEYGYILEPNIIDLTIETSANYSKEIVWGEFHNLDLSNQHFMGPRFELPEETGLGWCDLMPELEFFHSMPDGLRKDAFILQYVFTGKYNEDGTPIMVKWDDSVTNQKHPYFRKNVDDGATWDYNIDSEGKVTYTNGGLSWKSSRTKFLFRYADILLMYAEAKAFGNGADALAYTCINRVRTRAGLNELSGLSADAFKKAVLDERRWETCGMEGSIMGRFFTMQRHEILHKQKEYRDPNELPLNPGLTLSEDFYYFPIPDREVLIVPSYGD
jgi:hypothetical protein